MKHYDLARLLYRFQIHKFLFHSSANKWVHHKLHPIFCFWFTQLFLKSFFFSPFKGWSGGAMVLGKLPVPGRPTIWITVGQGPTALAVGAGGGCLDIFTLIYPFFPLSPSLWETARYRLKYCLKGPLNPKSTNQQLTVHYTFTTNIRINK